jgi:Zn-dependent peptidase ImmA (M78 family)/DNA-binding XRE family transcriptional regulator
VISKEQSQEEFAQLVGERVAFAREAAGLTQVELSERLGFKDRQILSNIEAGKRKVASDELLRLMEVLGRDLDFFTDPLRLVGEGAFSWRASAESTLLDDFETKAGEWVATFRHLCWASEQHFNPITPQLAITAKSSFEEVQSAAEQIAKDWKLGDKPAAVLPEKVEEELKILILFVNAPTGISGAACQLPQFNTIFINRNEPEGRRNFDLAHELFHVLTWDRLPPRRIDGREPSGSKDKRIERLANVFAAAMLMPAEQVKRQWGFRGACEIHEWLNELGLYFQVTAKAMKWRCVNLELLSEADLSGINDALLTFNGRSPERETKPRLFSKRFVERIHWALDNGALSVRKASRILGMTIDDIADLIRDHGLTVPFDL